MRTPRHIRAEAFAFLVYEIEDRPQFTVQLDLMAIERRRDCDVLNHCMKKFNGLPSQHWVSQAIHHHVHTIRIEPTHRGQRDNFLLRSLTFAQ
ncbi:MAG: hypothetical protein AAGA70_15375 [Pseudomonadota bacterium]